MKETKMIRIDKSNKLAKQRVIEIYTDGRIQ